MIEAVDHWYSANRIWIKRISFWSFAWFIVGFVAYVVRPELLPRFLDVLGQIFEEILGREGFVVNFQSVWAIFKQNFFTAVLSLYLGVILGLAPLLVTALNFGIFGFLFGASIFLHQGSSGLVIFLITVLPHGVVEIPALLLAAAMGARLGFSLWNREFIVVLKESVYFLPVLAVLIFVAAMIEVFVTGNLLKWLTQ